MEFCLLNSEFVAHGDIFFLVFDWYSFLVLIFTRGLKVTILSVEIKCGSNKCRIYVLHQLKREVAKEK